MNESGGTGLRQELLPDPGDGMPGVRLWVDIGQITPWAAAAVWWNLPAQNDELFPGASFRFRSGSLATNGFVYEVRAELPAVGPLTQAARYTVERADDGGYRITVDAFEENALWVRGEGVYVFHSDGGAPRSIYRLIDICLLTQSGGAARIDGSPPVHKLSRNSVCER